MPLTNEELHQLLRLALDALRAQGLKTPGEAGAIVNAAPVDLPAAKRLDDWLETYRGIIAERGYKAQTIRNRRAALGHVSRLWGDRPLADLKPHEIMAGLKREFLPRRSSTAKRVLAELRDVYAEALANGAAESNPAALCRPPRHRVLRQRLTLEVLQGMLTLARTGPQSWVEALLLLALVTGQRRADLAKMRFDDIVTASDGQRYLRVEQQKEAGKGYGARVEIPLSLRMDAVELSVGDVVSLCARAGRPGDTLLRKAGGGPIEVSSLSNRFAECIAAVLGADDPGAHLRPSLHEVRSLSARLYACQGVNVQTLLGHKRAEMTEVYTDDRGLSAHEWKRVQPCTVRQ